jgi:hypothetical protein
MLGSTGVELKHKEEILASSDNNTNRQFKKNFA